MSVLIKGVKMPTSCLKGGCPLDGFSCQLWEDKYWSSYEDPEKGRHRDCPLIELPDHGRLVDADDVIAEARSGDYWWETEEEIPGLLNEVPTIIPAERSGGGKA